MNKSLKNRINIYSLIAIIFSLLVFDNVCYSQKIKRTVIKLRPPEAYRSRNNLNPIEAPLLEVPHFYDPYDDYETVKGRLDKDGFYIYNLNLSFPQSIKLGANRILIAPTDTVFIDYIEKPFIRSMKDSTIWHFDVLNRNIQQYPLLRIKPSSHDYEHKSPLEFEQRIDSFYQAGIDYIKKYFTKYPHLDEFYRYSAKCDLFFILGRELIFYYNFHSHSPFQETTKKIIYPKDFLKYNDSISTYFNRLYLSEKGYNYFHDYNIFLVTKSNHDDYETTLNWIFNNTRGLIRDIEIGKTITSYQLRRFDEKYLPISLRFAGKIGNSQLRNTLLLRIDEMKNSQNNLKKEILNKQPKSLNDLLKNYKNKVVYVKFWATWCGPCLQDAEYLEDLIKQIKNENFVVVNICVKSPKLTWEKQLSAKAHFGEQIYLSDKEYNELNKEIYVPHLPYYLLVNQIKNIMIKDAPRPIPDKDLKINEELTKMIIKLLKN
jgi:thiol-disulfide isomerase/thioredoxin